MATDNTPPRLRLVVTIAVIVVITLVSLDFVFRSYYAYMTDEARAEKVAPKTALLAQNKAEADSFAGAKVPLTQAMAQVLADTKTRPDLIEPKPSDDTGPLTGWAKAPKAMPIGMVSAADAGAAPAATDAGITDAGATSTDEGGAPTNAVDAGPSGMHPKVPVPAQDAGQHGGH